MKGVKRPAGHNALNDLVDAAEAFHGSARNQPPAETSGAMAKIPAEIKVVEVDAFSSVHDMIHAAITSYGPQASLRQIYWACEEHGRIAYKRSGGSRLITHNDHWKSQIRHALYTCDRFQRTGQSTDLWTISPSFQRIEPQTTKVLIRRDSNAGSISDESQKEAARKPQRRATRSKQPADDSAPFLPVSQRRKRSSRQNMAAAAGSGQLHVERGSASPEEASPEGHDECSHNDLLGAYRAATEERRTPPPCRSEHDGMLEHSVGQHAPSPMARSGIADHTAWARVARRLGSALQGISKPEDEPELAMHACSEEMAPTDSRAQSAEAESPAATQQLYALRSRGTTRRAPPGFGDDPDPAAAAAAARAAAITQGPLKKRLKAAAKAAAEAEAASMAAAISSMNEEACSTRTGLGIDALVRGATPSTAEISCNKPPIAWRPPASASGPPAFAAPAQNLRSRGRGRSMKLIHQVNAMPTHGPQMASQSSLDYDELPATTLQAFAHSTSPSDTNILPIRGTLSARPLPPSYADPTAEEGADETDEGGGKRLLRSHVAAAAALEREGALDRSNCSS